jgi:ribose transport system substrate-binding protein
MSTLDQRTHGFNLGMQKYANIKNVGTQYNEDEETLAASQAAALITRYPNLGGMFAGNDFSGFGAATAIADAHKTGIVKLVTFDSDPGNIAYLKAGKVQAIIAQDPYAIGVKAVWIADMWIKGQRAGIARHYTTPLAVITKANYQSPAMQNFIYR